MTTFLRNLSPLIPSCLLKPNIAISQNQSSILSSVVRADKDSEHDMIVILCYVTLKPQTKFLKTYYCCYESTFQMILRIIVTLASS